MSKKLRKGDQVVVIAGNDKGKVGKILSKGKDRVVVQGVNVRKRHMKQKQQNQQSQIIEMEMPVHISNVSLSDSDGNLIKVKSRVNSDKTRDWVFMKKGKEAVYRSTKKSKA